MLQLFHYLHLMEHTHALIRPFQMCISLELCSGKFVAVCASQITMYWSFQKQANGTMLFIELQPLANHELSNRPGDLESHQVKDKKPCCSKHLLSWPGGRNAMLARPILGFYKQR